MTAIGIDTHKAASRPAPSTSSGRSSPRRPSPTTRPATRRSPPGRPGSAPRGGRVRGLARRTAPRPPATLERLGHDVREVPPQLSRPRARADAAGRQERSWRRPRDRPGHGREADLPPVRLADPTTATSAPARGPRAISWPRRPGSATGSMPTSSVARAGYGAAAANLVAAAAPATVGRALRRLPGSRPSSPATGSSAAPARRRGRAPRAIGSTRLVGRPPAPRVCQASAPLTAATLIAETGDSGRFRSADAFAMLAGVAPIPASSGQTQRMRLNRGGNRQLNRALHIDRPGPGLAPSPGQGIHRPQACRGQDLAGGHPLPQAATRCDRLQVPRRGLARASAAA